MTPGPAYRTRRAVNSIPSVWKDRPSAMKKRHRAVHERVRPELVPLTEDEASEHNGVGLLLPMVCQLVAKLSNA